MAVLMAAMHPERVPALVLYGGYAKRVRAEDYPWAQTDEERAAYAEILVQGWDWEADLRLALPYRRRGDAGVVDAPDARLGDAGHRAGADGHELAGRRARAPAESPPPDADRPPYRGLVLPDRGSRWIAGQIAGATMIVLEGADHFVSGNPASSSTPSSRSSPPPRVRHTIWPWPPSCMPRVTARTR